VSCGSVRCFVETAGNFIGAPLEIANRSGVPGFALVRIRVRLPRISSEKAFFCGGPWAQIVLKSRALA
jgi:hypothetical protein